MEWKGTLFLGFFEAFVLIYRIRFLRVRRFVLGRDGDRKSDEEVKTDVAVESEERPQKDRYRSVHGKTRKELIANLIKTYDALTKGSDEKSDAVEEELEVLSSKAAKRSANNGKVSKETAEAIKGFDITDVGKRNIPHPK